MIDSLTPEQEKLVEANRDAWLDKFFKYDVKSQFDSDRATAAIKEDGVEDLVTIVIDLFLDGWI